jgi:hypothetical protein
MSNQKICSICKKSYVGYGNNPAPYGKEHDRCCDACNTNYVIPLRIYQMTKHPNHAVLFKEDGTVENIKPSNEKWFSLEELQSKISDGGLIELYPTKFMNHMIVCDEEGLIKKRKPNEVFKSLTSIQLVGTVMLCPEQIFEEPWVE